MDECLAVLTLVLQRAAEVDVRVTLPDRVAELRAEFESSGQVSYRFVGRAELDTGAADVAVRVPLRGMVAQSPSRGQRDPLGIDPVLPVAAPVQEIGHGPGDLPGVRIKPGRGGECADSEQYQVLSCEPLERLLRACQDLRDDSCPGRC